ncbi:unnamed protein product [Lactuca virosa]|uniref:Uncharacterized protein n=1 Tax=Lactuca virosa TaxID=75947 RepID=A0AAU9M8T3_9ASTR|nr:unnamed protein product [Lactuca virosa]
MAACANGDDKSDMEEQEEALVALIEHRTKEVNHLRMRLAYYESELDESLKKLEETQRQLARLRSRSCDPSTRSVGRNVRVKKEISSSPLKICEDSFHNLSDESNGSSCDSYQEACLKTIKTKSKPLLVIPGMNPKVSPSLNKMTEYNKASSERKSLVKEKGYGLLPKQEAVESQARGTKRKFEENEHTDLSEVICSSSSPCIVNCGTSNHIPSQHKRKLRSLVLCPTNDQLFATSALDAIVNMWEIQDRGSHANLLSSINCASMKQRRWPEDVAWHPNGGSLISVYSADGGDSQIAILNLNERQEENEVRFLENKPHVKGIINNVMFMPWDNNCFITGGSDHGVVHWTQKHNDDDNNNSWKPKLLHRSIHSSAVMGVAGMQQKQTVVSVGADKRIIGFDLHTEKPDYKHQIESKCMSVVPNPCDFNLFMVQTGTPQKQLRLFDIRLKNTEIHEFGWKQESSMSQSALISQTWSPDGLYITSGSADPVIHIFDIRFNANQPSQSIKAHQKRVFKAAWHHSLPLLISISSDLNIGLHHIT